MSGTPPRQTRSIVIVHDALKRIRVCDEIPKCTPVYGADNKPWNEETKRLPREHLQNRRRETAEHRISTQIQNQLVKHVSRFNLVPCILHYLKRSVLPQVMPRCARMCVARRCHLLAAPPPVVTVCSCGFLLLLMMLALVLVLSIACSVFQSHL